MALTLTFKAGGQALALARASILAPTSPARWLVGMRWAALLGMWVTTQVAAHNVPGLVPGPIHLVLGTLAALNVMWTALLFRFDVGPSATVTPQLALDVLALTAVLWFSGGLQNPFASFLCFQIVLAGLLGTGRTMAMVTLLTMASGLMLSRAPSVNLDGSRWGTSTALLGEMMAVVALSAFTGFFMFVYQHRLETFRHQVARNDKLAALGRTLASMSHELNTPLGTMALAGKELTLVARDLNNPEVERLGTTVLEEATRASDVIALLRGYVRPDARREPVDVSTFIPTYVEGELDRLRFSGERVVRVGPSTEVHVIKAALCQIMTNVLRNAVEAMESQSQRRLEVDVMVEPEAVHVVVLDRGPGISPSLLATLGEPFQTTKQDAGGTGLGLYVSTLLAERMGATMALESGPGVGTKVTLSLPKRPRKNP